MDQQIAELNCDSDTFDTRYGNILNWIHYEVDAAQLKQELVTYGEKQGIPVVIPASTSFLGIEASIAYCLNRGALLKKSSVERLDNYIRKFTSDPAHELPKWEHLPETAAGKNIQSYVNCYSRLDNLKTMVASGKIDTRQISAQTRKIIESYSNGKSAVVKMLVEHYKQSVAETSTDSTIKDWQKPLSAILDVLMLLANNRAALKQGAKGAKARKMNSTVHQRDRKGEKAAAKVTYKEEDVNYGIRSIDPTLLVGSQAAVIFNSKTKHIEIYRSNSAQQLSIQGAKIINFDTSLSKGKTLRKPDRDLPQFARATNVRRLEVLGDGISGKTYELTGKLNRNSIIVKIL